MKGKLDSTNKKFKIMYANTFKTSDLVNYNFYDLNLEKQKKQKANQQY